MFNIIVIIQGNKSGLQSIVRPTIKNNEAKMPNDAQSSNVMLNITVAVTEEKEEVIC